MTVKEVHELDMDREIRYFKSVEMNNPEDADKVRHEAVETIKQLRDLLYELSSLEIDSIDGLLDYYKVKL